MKKLVMIVRENLSQDARVNRAALALSNSFDVVLVGIGQKSDNKGFRQIIIPIKKENSYLAYLEFIRKAKKIVLEEKADIVYGHDFYLCSLLNWVHRKMPGVKTVYDAHELYVPVDQNKLPRRNEYFYHFEKKTVQYVDLLIAANDDRAKIMREHYSLKTSPLVINNISYLPQSTYELPKELNAFLDGSKKVLVYAGIISYDRSISKAIEAVKNAKTKCKFLLIGKGDAAQSIAQKAESLIGEDFLYFGPIAYSNLSAVLSRCNVAFLNYPNTTLNNKYCASNKVYEYASVPLPILAGNNVTISRIMEKERIGIASDKLSDALDAILNNYDWYVNNCIAFCKNNLWENEARLLNETISGL